MSKFPKNKLPGYQTAFMDLVHNPRLTEMQKMFLQLNKLQNKNPFLLNSFPLQNSLGNSVDLKYIDAFKRLSKTKIPSALFTGNTTFLNRFADIYTNQQKIAFALKSFPQRSSPLPATFFANPYQLPAQKMQRNLSILQHTILGLNNNLTKVWLRGYTSGTLPGNTSEKIAKVADLTESIFNENDTIEIQLYKLRGFIKDEVAPIQNSIKEGVKTKKSLQDQITLLITLISFFYMFLQEYRYQTMTDHAHPDILNEINQVRLQLQKHMEDTVTTYNVSAILRTNCNLRLKPTTKSPILMHLENNTQVYIIEKHHKWVLISIIVPGETYPVIGWVYKKYVVETIKKTP